MVLPPPGSVLTMRNAFLLSLQAPPNLPVVILRLHTRTAWEGVGRASLMVWKQGRNLGVGARRTGGGALGASFTQGILPLWFIGGVREKVESMTSRHTEPGSIRKA